MTVPLLILAVLSIAAGYFGIPEFLTPVFEPHEGGAHGGGAIGIKILASIMREPEATVTEAPHLIPSPALSIVLACAVAGVILFGLFPNPVVNLALQSVLLLK